MEKPEGERSLHILNLIAPLAAALKGVMNEGRDFTDIPLPSGFISLQGFRPKQAFLKNAFGQEDLEGWEGGTLFQGFLLSIIALQCSEAVPGRARRTGPPPLPKGL